MSYIFTGSKVLYSGILKPNFNTFQSQPDTTIIINLISASQDLIYKGDGDAAIKNLEKAQRLSDSLDFSYGKALSKVYLADVFMYRQKHDSAIAILNSVIRDFPESRARPHFYNQLAGAYNYIAQPLKSIENYQRALQYVYLLKEDRQDRTKAGILVNMASAYKKLGDRENTFNNYLEGLRFAETSNDTIFLVITLNNLGDVYNEYEEYEKADFHLNRALKLAQEKDYKGELLRIYLNLGNVKSNLDDNVTAIDYYNKALVLNKIVRPNTPPFQILYNMGNLYLNQMNFIKAKEHFEESLKYCKELNIPQGLYYNYKGLGNLYNQFSQPYEAIKWYEKALEVATSLNLHEFTLDLHETLYAVHKQTESSEKALFHLEEGKHISDSLNEVRSKSDLANLESKIELDRQTEINRLLQEKQTQQEQQIELRERINLIGGVFILLILILLYFVRKTSKERDKVNKILNDQKIELENLNQSKDKLFAIVAHDLRSPMASMQGILYLINNSELTVEEIKELCIELEPTLQKNIETMDDLLIWSRKQLSGINFDKNKVDTKPIIDEVISKHSFQIDAKKINLINNIHENSFCVIDESAFKLIIRNLLTNAIKFTSENGRVAFSAKEENEYLIFSIQDNGIGIPTSLASSIFSDSSNTRPGTNKEAGNGFGLSVCKEFAQKMNGEIYFESEEGSGTTFYLKLPKS